MIWSPTLHLFALCAAILVMKMLMTGYATSVLRNVRRVYLSPEDYAFWGREPGPPDPQIERIRRAHQNDKQGGDDQARHDPFDSRNKTGFNGHHDDIAGKGGAQQ